MMMKFACLFLLSLSAVAGSSAEMRVERLNESIYRIRIGRDGVWPDSKMNEYGIISKFSPQAAELSDLAVIRPQVKQVGKGFELRFPLEKNERIYGLGDVCRDGIQRRGGRYEMWVANLTSYIPIPMAMSSRGWGVMVNTTRRHVFDVGKADPDAMIVTAEEGEVDFYVFVGKGYRELLDAYTQLTGRPSLLPAFAYGFTYVANQWIDMFALADEASHFRELGIPCDTIGLEPGWMEYFYDSTTKKSWNQSRFSFPHWTDSRTVTWIGGLERMGFKLSLWLCMNYDLFVFEEACAKGLAAPSRDKVNKALAKDVVATWVDEHVGGKFDDVKEASVNPRKLNADIANARTEKVKRIDGLKGSDQSGEEPWFDHLKKFVDRGARCFKLDCCEQGVEHEGRIWAGKYTDALMHNVYPVVYAKQMAEGYQTYTDSRAMVYSACGYAGVQRYVATWAGDTGGGVRPLVSALNLGNSGHPNQGCDMEQFNARSAHFACLSPWSQQNNWDYFRQPWYCSRADLDMLRNYLNLRYRLFPYIYAAAAEAARTGWPFMRALALEYPDVAEYADECGTYLFGDNLLVSAFSDTVKIPAGTWYEWRSGAEVNGPATLPVTTAADWGGALYVRAGAIIPQWPQKDHIDKGWNEKVELHVYLGADGAATWYEDDGDSLKYKDGAYASARIELRDGTLTIGAMEGAFADMPKGHDITVVWHNGPKTKVTELGFVQTADETTVAAPWLWIW